MKLFLLIAFALTALSASAATATNVMGSLISVNGTNTSSAVVASTFTAPRPTLTCQNGGLASTNAETVYVDLSIDGSNFMNVASFKHSATNAAVERFSPTITNQNVYMRVRIITTNATSVGVTLQY